jgi:hypothetical protein
MTQAPPKPDQSVHPLQPFIERLLQGDALLPDNPTNLIEVVGILKSYGVVLDAYARNLKYVATDQFLLLFPFFKYFNGEVTTGKLLRHWWHDRINYEYAEYCMKGMLWHGGGGLDDYLDSDGFKAVCGQAIQAKFGRNPIMQGLHRLFPEFLPEQVRQSAYYSALGQFWTVMSDIFLTLSDRYDAGDITTIPEVVDFIKAGLVKDAALPISFEVTIRGDRYALIPESAGLTFLADTAIPYVEAVFFRGGPFSGDGVLQRPGPANLAGTGPLSVRGSLCGPATGRRRGHSPHPANAGHAPFHPGVSARVLPSGVAGGRRPAGADLYQLPKVDVLRHLSHPPRATAPRGRHLETRGAGSQSSLSGQLDGSPHDLAASHLSAS